MKRIKKMILVILACSMFLVSFCVQAFATPNVDEVYYFPDWSDIDMGNVLIIQPDLSKPKYVMYMSDKPLFRGTQSDYMINDKGAICKSYSYSKGENKWVYLNTYNTMSFVVKMSDGSHVAYSSYNIPIVGSDNLVLYDIQSNVTAFKYLTFGSAVFKMSLGFFDDLVSIINSNVILFLSVIVGFALSAILFVVGMIKRFGVRHV